MTDMAFTNTQQKNKAKLIILTNNSIIKDKHLDIAKKIESILLEHLTIPSKFQN